jgi:uncharacterized protein YbjT (DUF2867 family)
MGRRVDRIAVMSASPVGGPSGHPTIERLVAVPLLQRVFGAVYDDMRRMEDVLASADLRWSALRPPRLVERRATGRHRLSPAPLPGGRTIARADLATALLHVLDAPVETACVTTSGPGTQARHTGDSSGVIG